MTRQVSAPVAITLSRVSTERQNRLSPKVQRERMKAYVESQGWHLAAELGDAASGRTDEREGLQAAVALAEQLHGLIVVYDSSRLFRNARQALNLFEELDRKGAAIVSVTDMLDSRDSTPFGKLIRTLMAAISEYQSDETGAKVAASNKATVDRLGYRTNGQQPAGYKLVPVEPENPKSLLHRVEDPGEQEIIAAVKDAVRAAGWWKWDAAAEILRTRGVPTISQYRNYVSAVPWNARRLRIFFREVCNKEWTAYRRKARQAKAVRDKRRNKKRARPS